MNYLDDLKKIKRLAAFNRWCGIEVIHADQGEVAIALDGRDEFGQYSVFYTQVWSRP